MTFVIPLQEREIERPPSGKWLAPGESVSADAKAGGLRLSAAAVEEGDRSPRDSAWEQLSFHLELAEKSLKAHHESIIELLTEHLGPFPETSSGTPPTSGARTRLRDSVASLEELPREHRTEAPPSTARGTLHRAPSILQVPDPLGRPGAPVPAPKSAEPELHLPGQLHLTSRASVRSPESSGSRGSQPGRSSTLKSNGTGQLVLLPIWATRREKRENKLAKGAKNDDVVQPIQVMEDDELEPHTICSTGCARHIIFHPLKPFRMSWDIASLFMVLYDIIMIPMGFFDMPEDDPVLKVLEWCTRIFWTVDIVTSFVSGYVGSNGLIEMRLLHVWRRYLKSWFMVDAIVVGVDWAEIVMKETSGSGVARMGKASRPFRIIRMVRLLRLARMGEIVQMLMERLPSDMLVVFGDILKLIIAMLGMCHLIACLWWAVGEASPEGEDNNWIDTVTGPGDLTWRRRELKEQYIMSFRWALTQFAGGMDEVVPHSFLEHMYAALIFVVSFWSGTVFLSILTSHMTQLFIIGSQQKQQLSHLRRYLSQHGVSRNLAMRAQRNAQHVISAQQRTMSEQAVGLMDLVSKALRIELHYEMYSPVLSMHPFFNDYMQVCPPVVRKICHAGLSLSVNSSGDVIFHFGETASGMILVKSGTLRYSWGVAKEPSILDIKENSYISEAALWVHWVHRGALTVAEDSILIYVNTESFQGIVGQFEKMSFDPSEYAAWFVDKMNECEDEVTDLPMPGTEVLPANLTRQSKAISIWKATSRATRRSFDPWDLLREEETRESLRNSAALTEEDADRRSSRVSITSFGDVDDEEEVSSFADQGDAEEPSKEQAAEKFVRFADAGRSSYSKSLVTAEDFATPTAQPDKGPVVEEAAVPVFTVEDFDEMEV